MKTSTALMPVHWKVSKPEALGTSLQQGRIYFKATSSTWLPLRGQREAPRVLRSQAASGMGRVALEDLLLDRPVHLIRQRSVPTATALTQSSDRKTVKKSVFWEKEAVVVASIKDSGAGAVKRDMARGEPGPEEVEKILMNKSSVPRLLTAIDKESTSRKLTHPQQRELRAKG